MLEISIGVLGGGCAGKRVLWAEVGGGKFFDALRIRLKKYGQESK